MIGYQLLNAEKVQISCPSGLTVESIWDYAKKMAGKELYFHAYSEQEIRLYDEPLRSPTKNTLYYIVGNPRRGCCGG
jgi:hypothetical protein